MVKEAIILVVLLGVFSQTQSIYFAASAILNRSSVDESSLLSMKAHIKSHILATNWSQDTSFCTWSGIICGKKRPHRVTAINLSNLGLEGSLAKEIANLSFLRFLDISSNAISGLIPSEIGLLGQLRALNLSNNYFTGDIPTTLSASLQLNILDLSHNHLTGTLPPGFHNLSLLQELSLSSNYLTGRFPASIGNLSKLELLDISNNSFYGTLASEMGQLSSLRILNIQANNLSGEVPQPIFNLSTLHLLSLRENDLSGTLPFSIARGLPSIEHIFLGNIETRFDLRANRFYGEIPNSITNLSKLTTLDLSYNSFTHVPLNLGSLHQLQMLNLEGNQLMNNLSVPGQDFLSSLAACKNLRSIQISSNPISGVLPKSLGSSNLSWSLETLRASSCRLSYPIHDEIGNLSSLLWLNLGYNHFNGAFPTILGGLRSLRNLDINGNRFQGSISPALCNLKHLHSLNVATNNLSGQLPSCLGNLPWLREIYMSHNEFNSEIASFLWFDKGASNGKNLVTLDMSWNQLFGEIPSTISQLENLVTLSLSRNKLEGRVVESFSLLKDLRHLDLSHNNLSGPIPKSFEELPRLNYFDVSFNALRGEIPNRGCFANFTTEFFIGNKDLCGAPRFQVKKCRPLSKKKQLSYLSVLVVLVIGLALILVRRTTRVRKPSLSGDVPSDFNKSRGITYNEILHATGNFNEENLIARGGISSVYLGRFSDEKVYAVKVFALDVQGALRSFYTESHIWSSVRHRNLLNVQTCCFRIDFGALVMAYMPNGDLEKWLYSANCSLSLFEILGIMKDVACAVEYLHDHHVPTIIHCDLNPKNILLDEDMVAHVGDFGVAKLLHEGERLLCSRALGTVGYIAPEYGSEGLISRAADVYSYGILLIETLSRRRPTDEMFSGELTLRRWVMESFTGFVRGVVENEATNMVSDENRVTVESWLTSAVVLALQCSADLGEERPSMKYVVAKITYIYSNFKNLVDSFLA